MYLFGSKSVSWLLAMILTLFVLLLSPSATLENFLEIDPLSTFVMGVMASFLSAMIYRATRPDSASEYCFGFHYQDEPSNEETVLFQIKQYYFTIIENIEQEKVMELPQSLQKTFMFLVFLILGFVLFNQQEARLFSTFHERLSLGKVRYCPGDTTAQQQAADRPECALVIRAMELGYAKDLGACADLKQKEPVLCDLRQEDEPYFHYSARLLVKAFSFSTQSISLETIKVIEEQIEDYKERLESIAITRMNEVVGAPRSRHFVVSTLPPPEDPRWTQFKDLAQPSRCIDEYSRLPNKIDEPKSKEDLSKGLTLALGHLLFDSKYKQVVTSCREYNYVWGVEKGSCMKMVRKPVEALTKMGIYEEIQLMLERYDHRKVAYKGKEIPRPEFFISVSCLEYDKVPASNFMRKVRVGKHKITMKVYGIPPLKYQTGDSINTFKMGAYLAGPKFIYGQLQSQASVNTSKEVTIQPEMIYAEDYRLSRLGFLEDVDIFLQSSWVLERDDLLEVYPYYLHLSRFVDTFRENYERSRGRL